MGRISRSLAWAFGDRICAAALRAFMPPCLLETDCALLLPAHPAVVSARRVSVDVVLLDLRAFHGGLILPVLGFIFLPVTTIVYAWELNSGMPPWESIS
jgi:hypothetical protein